MDDSEKDKQIIDDCKWRGTWREDWRIRGQEGYLMRKKLQHRVFSREICIEDYDQCEFCWKVFDQDSNHPLFAYYEPTERVWICETCFKDFDKYFHWTVEEIRDNG